MNILITHKCNPDIERRCGATALMYAAGNGHKEVVEILLSTKICNLDIQNTDGYTAFTLACYWGHIAICLLLIDAGCDYNLVDERGKTGIDWLMDQHPIEAPVVQVDAHTAGFI